MLTFGSSAHMSSKSYSIWQGLWGTVENHNIFFLRKTHDIIPSISILQTERATCKLVNNYGWLRIIFNNWMSFHTWIIIGQLRSSIIRQLKNSITKQLERNKVCVEKSILKGQIALKIDFTFESKGKLKSLISLT